MDQIVNHPRVLGIFAHPDDAELLCGGTLKLLADAGCAVRIVTASGGDVGSPDLSREEIREVRLEEAARGAASLGADYRWAGLHDLRIFYCPEQLEAMVKQIRDFRPDVVITHSPSCYMVDHEEVSKLVRMAAFGAGIRLFAPEVPAGNLTTPALYYADALEGVDLFGKSVPAEFWINIEGAFEHRQKALACHESQREWLRKHHGIDEYLEANIRLAQMHGARAGVAEAEGFRQHRGHGYPHENVLGRVLQSRLIENLAYDSE